VSLPGDSLSSISTSVVAWSTHDLSRSSSGTIFSCQTPASGSSRVRHVRGFFLSDGIGPAWYLRAVLSDMPAAAAAASWVFHCFNFRLNNLTCLSVTIRSPPWAVMVRRRQDDRYRKK
jgi:hypothetical protein